MGALIGTVTNIIPGTTNLRNQYTPNNGNDYNNSLRATDASFMAIGEGMKTGGGIATVSGLAVAAVGGTATLSVVGAPVTVPVAGVGLAVAGTGLGVTAVGAGIQANVINNSTSYSYGKKEVNGNSASSKKPSGNYTNTHKSGKTYSGVGNEKRMNTSAKVKATKNNDPVVKQNYVSRPDKKTAYINEHLDIQRNGGAGNTQRNYNIRNSPGKKIVESLLSK